MRPQYHFTSKANWLSDPNGLVHDGTLWHMFFQHNPHGEAWGHMAWGHATSPDLAGWSHHEPALLEDEAGMIFSGSAVIDRDNSAGFGAGAMVAIYTLATGGTDYRQSQSLAYSVDGGLTWARYGENPVLTHEERDFRDPSVFWHRETGRWVMAVALSDANAVLLYVSDNLRDWRQTCRIDADGTPGRLWECPALIELPVAGTKASCWVLKVDAMHDAPGSGTLYRTGQFDGERFLPDGTGWRSIDWGSDFYAAIPWNGPRDGEGRLPWIGWMGNHGYQHDFPTCGWRGVMSLPRRLGLVDRGGIVTITQTVEPSLFNLFDDARPLTQDATLIPVASRLDIAADFEGSIRIELGRDRFLALDFGADPVELVRQDADMPFLDCRRQMPRPEAGGWSLYLDTETCELLSADGTVAASVQIRSYIETVKLLASPYEKLSIAPLRQCPAA